MKRLPTRMCIGCKRREYQKNFIRLMCKDGGIKKYDNNGRSFYICKECIKEEKKIKKPLGRLCKKEIKLIDLEKIIYG